MSQICIQIILGTLITFTVFFEISYLPEKKINIHFPAKYIYPERKMEEASLSWKLITGIIFLLFAFLLFYKLSEIPVPYHWDEAGAVYDAISIEKYGVDRYLNQYPVYFVNSGDGQSALNIYLMVLCIKLFGYSVLSVRLPAVVLSLISLLFFVRMIRNEYGNFVSIISMILFCILPFTIMHSRWGLDAYLLFPMTIISCSVFYDAVCSKKDFLYVVAGILFGITLYSYAVSWVFLALFLLIFFVLLLFTGLVNLKQLLALGIPLFILSLPLLGFLAVNNGMIDEIRTEFFSIIKVMNFRSGDMNLRNIIDNLKFGHSNIFYNMLFADWDPYNSNLKYGTMYYFSLPVILLGFYSSFQNFAASLRAKIVSMDVMMQSLFFASMITSLLLNGINVNRVCEIFISLIYFLCIGFSIICRKHKSMALVSGGIYLLLFAFFIRFYFVLYPRIDLKSYSVPDLERALSYVDSINPEHHRVYMIGGRQGYIYYLIAGHMDPYSFSEGKKVEKNYLNEDVVKSINEYHFLDSINWDGFPDEPILYIFRNVSDIPWKMDYLGMESKQFGSIKVYCSSDYFSDLNIYDQQSALGITER